jgi:taurine dioxygenase
MSEIAARYPGQKAEQKSRQNDELMAKPRSYPSFTVDPLTPHLGAEVLGVDLVQPITAPVLRDIRAAWADWSVLVFRDQQLDREAHKAFGRNFGHLHVHPMNHLGNGDPELLTGTTAALNTMRCGTTGRIRATANACPSLAMHDR